VTLFNNPIEYINIKTYVIVRQMIHTVLHIDYRTKYRKRVSTNPRNSNPCKSRTYCISFYNFRRIANDVPHPPERNLSVMGFVKIETCYVALWKG
jgi:hypothetical protein